VLFHKQQSYYILSKKIMQHFFVIFLKIFYFCFWSVIFSIVYANYFKLCLFLTKRNKGFY